MELIGYYDQVQNFRADVITMLNGLMDINKVQEESNKLATKKTQEIFQEILEKFDEILENKKVQEEINKLAILEIKKKLDNLENIQHCGSSQMNASDSLIVQVNPAKYYYYDWTYGQWREYQNDEMKEIKQFNTYEHLFIICIHPDVSRRDFTIY